MRVCVTGNDGYLGSLLTAELLKRGYEVIGLDTGFYKERMLYRGPSITPLTQAKDVRQVEASDLKETDAVVHMAELSNDPLGQLAPTITYEINHRGSVQLAEQARQVGVKRFVYMSSCSVYGVADRDFVDEESPVNPQTAYAVCKTLVERDVKAMASDGFSPTFMRNATAYGASPRMRFDIVLNNLAGLAWTTKKIEMTSDGTPWRPLVHGLDICRATPLTITGSEKSPKSSPMCFPAAASRSVRPARTIAATGSHSRRSASICRSSSAPGTRGAGRSNSTSCSSGST